MIWELWEYPGGQSFFPKGDVDGETYDERVEMLRSDEPEAACVWTVETDDYDAAMQAMYDHRGWGRYRPISELTDS